MQHIVPAEATWFTEAGFRGLAANRLHRPTSAAPDPDMAGWASGPSDYDLTPHLETELEARTSLRPAAVLVPIVARGELTVLLTSRTDHLPSHAGQIAFPGGKIEATDPSPAAAALREAEEEIGLSPRLVEPLGYLDAYRTGTGFRIIPTVAMVKPDFTLNLNRAEVTDAFEVPLAFLMDERNYRRHVRTWQGRERIFHAVMFEGRFIWGATAGMLRNLHQRVFRP